MKKQTEYQKAMNKGKELRKLSFLDEYSSLTEKVCNSIKESMKKLGRDLLVGQDIEFLELDSIRDQNIIGVNVGGSFRISNGEFESTDASIRRMIIDGDISIEDAIALDDELKSMLG